MSFPVDALGRYSVKYDILDESGRHGAASAQVDVFPPPGAAVVQLGWSNFDATDDPTTFPRIELRATTEKPGATCNEQGAHPAWCEVTRAAHVAHMRLKNGRYAISVAYTDDRFAGAPVACVRVFLDGKQTSQHCDPAVQSAGSVWAVGFLDAATGKFDSDIPDAGADASPEGGAKDGGAKDAATDAKAGGGPKDAAADATAGARAVQDAGNDASSAGTRDGGARDAH
jgi:hypothetical protein